MDHNPTFVKSADRRPLHRRLTPAAWALIVVLAVFCVGCSAAGALRITPELTAPGDGLWRPTETPTAVPTGTPGPTDGPSPTPTGWWEGDMTPTVEPTVGFPVWWADQMTQDADDHLLPPQEVQDQVWEAFIGGLRCWNMEDRDEPPEESQKEIVQGAAQYLSDDPEVWRVACYGATNFEEATPEEGALFLLVDFGPRNNAFCDESPTQCVTGVSVTARAGLSYHEDTCQQVLNVGAPCIMRPPKFYLPYSHLFYTGQLEYDERTGGWRIVYLEEMVLEE